MKKKLLVASLIFTSIANAQFTQTNEPALAATTTMFICDSSYTDAAGTNGSGVTWDFSNITGYTGNQSKIVSVTDGTGTLYTGATKITNIPGLIASYWNSTSTDRTSQGFIFTEATVGDVEVNLAGNNEKIMNYPFAFAGTLTDTYSGTLYNGSFANPAVACTGTITSTVDGSGTLILSDGQSFSNVLRHKVVETTNATIVISSFPTAVTVTRTQYDYVAATGNGLPLFTNVNIAISSLLVNTSVSVVMSSVDPTASISENNESNFKIYPNPTQGNVTITGDFSSDASATVVDQSGRIITSLETLNNGSTIDLSGINKGVYFVVISNNGMKNTKTITVN